MKLVTGKIFALILISISALGVLAFFPVQLSENNCCPFQKYVSGSSASPACCANCSVSSAEKMAQHHPMVVHEYMTYYAVPWWCSIAGLLAGIAFFRKKSIKSENQKKQETTH